MLVAAGSDGKLVWLIGPKCKACRSSYLNCDRKTPSCERCSKPNFKCEYDIRKPLERRNPLLPKLTKSARNKERSLILARRKVVERLVPDPEVKLSPWTARNDEGHVLTGSGRASKTVQRYNIADSSKISREADVGKASSAPTPRIINRTPKVTMRLVPRKALPSKTSCEKKTIPLKRKEPSPDDEWLEVSQPKKRVATSTGGTDPSKVGKDLHNLKGLRKSNLPKSKSLAMNRSRLGCNSITKAQIALPSKKLYNPECILRKRTAKVTGENRLGKSARWYKHISPGPNAVILLDSLWSIQAAPGYQWTLPKLAQVSARAKVNRKSKPTLKPPIWFSVSHFDSVRSETHLSNIVSGRISNNLPRASRSQPSNGMAERLSIYGRDFGQEPHSWRSSSSFSDGW